MIENKKAQIPIGTVLVIIVVAILGIVFLFKLNYILKNLFFILGGLIIISGLWYAFKHDKQFMKILLITFILGAAVISMNFLGLIPQEMYSGATVKYVVPVMASIKCDVMTAQQTSTFTIPTSGYNLNKNTIANTGTFNEIVIDQPSLIAYGRRIRYSSCDASGNNCIEKITSEYSTVSSNFAFNKKSVTLPSFRPSEISYKNIVFETQTLPTSSWTAKNTATIRVTYQKYGLKLMSTSVSLAGKIICSDSCDLNCPAQTERAKIVYEGMNTLKPEESVDYIERWDDVSQANEQLGGTMWLSDTQEFCFGGFIYDAGTLFTQDSSSWIYPKTYDRKVDCCPGAAISSSSDNKVCGKDFKWQTITSSTVIPCTSDYSCPGQGTATCQQKNGIQVKSGWSCVNKVCTQQADKQVECCVPDLGCAGDQVCSSDNKCVLGGETAPISQIGNDSQNGGGDISCSWYQQSYITNDVDKGLFSWRTLFGSEITKTKTGCETSGWVYLVIILGSIIAVIFIIIQSKPKKKRKF